MYLVTKRKILNCLFFVLAVSFLTILYSHYEQEAWEPYFNSWTLSDTISCHYLTDNDGLPSAEDLTPPPDSIFFHETSCRGGLNSRQACAVESVARIHPDRNIYVLFSSPISELVLKKSCLSKLMQFGNVKVARLHIMEYSKGTALEDLLAHKENNKSQWRIEHTSDMLRYITMYKYGGVYLDTDMLVVRNLDDLGKNWVAREDEGLVNVAAMAISSDGLGHNLVETILNAIKSDYRPHDWLYSGPGSMNRVLLEFCNASTIIQLSAAVCHGFEVYNPEVIYPIHWQLKEVYFRPGDIPESVAQAYSHHLWNRLSHDLAVEPDSPYDRLAKRHCPTIRFMFGDRFGT